MSTSDASNTNPASRLYLVSVGIGDPDQITLRAQRTIERADVIFGMQKVRDNFAHLIQGKPQYDAGHGLFTALALRGADPAEVETREREVREIVQSAVGAGQIVAILDYGDPTIFGPQAGYLNEFADLHPVVVPGISSFNAANAALARGVTDGQHTHSVILTAAMSADEGYQGRDTLAELARSRSTLVFFTMRMQLAEVVAQLKQHYPGDTPIAIVTHAGTSGRQAVRRATLDTAVKQLGADSLPFEHMIYVGDFLR